MIICSLNGTCFENRTATSADINAVAWSELAEILRHKFALFTGARREISDADLNYMAEKLIVTWNIDNKPITFHRFAKVCFIKPLE